MTSTTDQKNGFTLVEVMVVLILLTLSFMVFLRALNTGETIRARSEIRTTQSVILNSLENEIRARRFDENASYPWSSTLGKDTGESQLIQFDDIDDFDVLKTYEKENELVQIFIRSDWLKIAYNNNPKEK